MLCVIYEVHKCGTNQPSQYAENSLQDDVTRPLSEPSEMDFACCSSHMTTDQIVWNIIYIYVILKDHNKIVSVKHNNCCV